MQNNQPLVNGTPEYEFKPAWRIDFKGSGPIDRRDLRFEPMRNGMHQVGNVFDGKSVKGLRHAATYGVYTDEIAFRQHDKLIMKCKVVDEPNPYRHNVTGPDGYEHRMAEHTLHCPWLDTYARDDPNSPNKFAGINTLLQTRVSFERMVAGGARGSFWTMPAFDKDGNDAVSDAYNDKDDDGMETDCFEYDPAAPNILQCKHIGGEAGQTPNGAIDARDFGFDLTNGYHTLGLLRTTEATVWLLNGVEILRDEKLISLTKDYVILSFEINSGAKMSPQPHELQAKPPFVPPDSGLYAANVFKSLDLLDKQEMRVEYIEVWAVKPLEKNKKSEPMKPPIEYKSKLADLSNWLRDAEKHLKMLEMLTADYDEPTPPSKPPVPSKPIPKPLPSKPIPSKPLPSKPLPDKPLSSKPSLVSPKAGSTITGVSLTLKYIAGAGAPVGRKFDIHGSLSPQPTVDTPSSGYGNDVFDSVSIGSVLKWTNPDPLPPGVYTIYGRIRYTDKNFKDNATTIADGRYFDFQLQVDITAKNTGHLANLLDLDTYPLVSIGDWSKKDWEALFGLRASYTPTNSSLVSLVSDNGVRKIRQEHIPNSSGTANVIAPMRFSRDDRGTYKRVRVRQRIGLPSNWTFGTTSFGGKLGMYIGGGVNTAGGLIDPSGCTLRVAFGHDYKTGKNYLSMYDYAAERGGSGRKYGRNTLTTFELFAGMDFLVEYEAQMNTTYKDKDGWYKVWINGVLYLDIQGIGWMTQARLNDTEPKWNRIGRSQKHGGNTAARSPTSATHAFNWDISWEGYN